ncbi:uncharacterized protein WCC33_001313 [Rhinophrynus dorsalis]
MMNKDKNHVNEKILNLTLEIIFLLTGEDCMVVRKREQHVTDGNSACVTDEFCRTQSPIIEPSSNSLIQERDDDQESLERTIKIEGGGHVTPELLTRNAGDSVLSVSEHQNSLEEKVQPYTWADEPVNRNTPERCPIPHCSQDCAEEDNRATQDYTEEDNGITQDYQMEPGDGMFPQQWKEEEIPAPISRDFFFQLCTSA